MQQENESNNLNRDMNIFGKIYVDKFRKLKIFIYGLRGLGCEIAKNILRLNVS